MDSTTTGTSNVAQTPDSPDNNMPPYRSSESARLLANDNHSGTNFINAPSYICTSIFMITIIYCSFSHSGIVLFAFHPIFMSVGWLVFMSVAVNAITPGDLASEWMPIRLRSARHWVIQILTGIFVTLGFIVIVSNKLINGKPHFNSYHSKFGLASFVLMFGAMLGGLGALYSLKLKHYIAPLYMKIIHASAGLITYILGSITIILGFFTNWWNFGDTLRYLSLILVLIIALFTVLRPTLKIYFRLKERLETMR